MWPPVLKSLLAVIDVTVLGLMVSLLASNFRSRQHGTRSWATAFHILVLLWLILRGIFWIMTIITEDRWHGDVFYLLYWLPNPLQFGSFSLLPLFYSQVLSSKREWKARSRIITPVYITLVSGMLVYMLGWTIRTAIQERKEFQASHRQCATAERNRKPTRDCYEMEFASEAFRVLTAMCFFALAAVVAAYGVKMSKLTQSQNRLYLIYQPRALAALNCFLFTVFLSKGAYQISSVMGLWYLPDVPLQGSKDLCLLNFAVFFYWDYMPTVWLLLFMTGSDGSNVGNVVKAVFPSRALNIGDTRNLPDYGLFREIKFAAAAEEAARAEAQNSMGYQSFQSGMQYSLGPGTEPSPVANSWFRDSSQTNNPYGSRTYSQNSAFGNNSVYTSGGESMLYGGSGYGSTSGSVGGMHPGSAGGSSVGSGLNSTAFASAPSPPAPTHPDDPHRHTAGWIPWKNNNSSSTATTSASTWTGFGGRAEQRGGSGDSDRGSRSNSLNRPAATNTGTGNGRGLGDERQSAGESTFRWWRGILGGGGGASAVPPSSGGRQGETSTFINPSLGSLSRLGGAAQGEAMYSLRGHGRGPGKAGVLISGEAFERGAFETGETFLSATKVPHHQQREEGEEEETCGQGGAAIDGVIGATRKGPQQHQHRHGGSGGGVRSEVTGSHPAVEQSPVPVPADYQDGERWRGGNETFAYDQRKRDSAPTPPSVHGRDQVETTALAPPSGATRQDSSLMSSQDPSLMTHQDPSLLARQDPSLMAHQDPSLILRQDPSLMASQDPSLMVRQDPSLMAHQDPSLMARQDPSLMDRQDPSLMVHEHQHSSFSAGEHGKG